MSVPNERRGGRGDRLFRPIPDRIFPDVTRGPRGPYGYRVARSPHAPLSPAELNALRRVANGLANAISTSHRELLASMGLIAVAPQGSLVLTQEGRARLAALTAGQPPIKGSQPPAD